ncbi:MAG: Lysophospholipase [Rhodobacteraceae bacterium HLUCCO07]|nr:MAG: Lysophospholipase [Rhodobacteraceae bacterium HLUCCO07]
MIARILIFLGISVLIYFGIAFGMILSQSPDRETPAGQSLDFAGLYAGQDAVPEDDPRMRREQVEMPDGTRLAVTHVLPDASSLDDVPLVIMLHGSGWHGGQFDALAWKLRDLAEVKAVTLRGHGADPVRRGDVDYVGQFEDDLAHLISETPGRRVVLLGHSSGGGLVVRMAGGAHGDLIDEAILLAPFLQYDAPMTRDNSGGWAHPLIRRIIGLSMLNMVGIHALDHLTAIQFAMPRAVLDGPMGHMATTAYSWRLNQSFAPRRDWRADVAALPDFLLIAGGNDEAFDATGYEPVLSEVTDRGRYVVVPGVGHLGIVDHPETLAEIRNVLQ